MTLPRYSAYRESGCQWFHQIPAHWQVKPLKRIATLLTGVTPPADDESNYAADGFPWVRPEDLNESGSAARATKSLSPKGVAQARPVEPGASLICCIGTIGKVGFAGRQVTTNQQITAATFAGNARYFYYATTAARRAFEVAATGNVLRILNSERLGEIRYVEPTTDEQAAIATFLDHETAKIDALIAEQEKLIALLAEKRQATISHAVTRGLNPDAPMRDSGVSWLGEVPAHWAITRLKFVAAVQTGIAKGKDTADKQAIAVPYLRVANVQDGFLDLEHVATIDVEPEQLARYRLQPGDVLMNEGGDFDKLGRGAIWRGEVVNCIHQNHVFAVRPHGVSSEWLNCVTSSQYAQFYFMGRSKQSTNLASISASNIMELPVILPPDVEQHDILRFVAAELGRLDELTGHSVSAVSLLRERRSALIAAAVTGQIDVRGLMPQETVAA